MTIETFKNTLVSKLAGRNLPVYHVLATPEDECPVLCWQETGVTYAAGDDTAVAKIISVELDLFVTEEYSDMPQTVDDALGEMMVSRTMDGVEYDIDRDEWRHTWSCQFFGG